jgi:hypothetical protein
MSDDLNDRGPRDRSRINFDEEWEIRWWCMKFGVTEEQLRSAVDTVGPTSAEIERHLKQAARESFKKMGED